MPSRRAIAAAHRRTRRVVLARLRRRARRTGPLADRAPAEEGRGPGFLPPPTKPPFGGGSAAEQILRYPWWPVRCPPRGPSFGRFLIGREPGRDVRARWGVG